MLMTALTIGGVGLVLFLMGFGLAFYMIGRDPTIVRLGGDEQIVKKPASDLTLVAVPPEVLRKLVVQRDSRGAATEVEAREMYRKLEVEPSKSK